MKNLLLIAIIVLGFSGVSFAQNPSATATAASSATIITPLTITNVSGTGDLLFGSIISNGAIGTVVVSPSASATATYSGVKPPVGLAGTIQAASFTVSGMNSALYTITGLANFEVKETGGETMQITNVTASPAIGALSSMGSQTIYVGATLNVKTPQKAALYTSAAGLTITVAYN